MQIKARPTLLVILDGFGYSSNTNKNAIRDAHLPCLNSLFKSFPFCTLDPGGTAVGLPKGVVGNSEVGHLNLGAGRPVRQDLIRINESIADQTFSQREEWINFIQKAGAGTKRIHLMGLISDGGVHSHLDHLKEIVHILSKNGNFQIFLHGFLDGRDTPPKSALKYLNEIDRWKKKIHWGSLQGRSWGMDRDRRWEKIRDGYQAMIGESVTTTLSPQQYIQNQYDENLTDEFITPISFGKENAIQNGDSVFFFNFRPDRAIQITLAMMWSSFKEFPTPVQPGQFLCMTPYCPEEVTLPILFDKEKISGTLGEYLSKLDKKQFRIAETEKFAHITYFFNGGRKDPFPGEDRTLIPSPKEVATYDQKPEMSALQVTENLLNALEKNQHHFYLVNFANPDMVGHTGNYEAAIKAVEYIDQCLQRIMECCFKHEINLLVTADHGNADQMAYPDGTPNTSHSDAFVPFCFVAPGINDLSKFKFIDHPSLKDVAPTVLWSMGIPLPENFVGRPILTEFN